MSSRCCLSPPCITRTMSERPTRALSQRLQRPDITILHRTYFMNAIKFHSGDLDDRWVQLEQETLKIAYDVVGGSQRAITANEINDALARRMTGVSARLAARFFIDRLMARLIGG